MATRDRLLYLTIGMLVGMVVMQWTMPSAEASRVFPGGVVAISDHFVLDENGAVWYLPPVSPASWERSAPDPPVPVSQIKFWEVWLFVTIDNIAWVYTGSPVTGWENAGPWPGPASAIPAPGTNLGSHLLTGCLTITCICTGPILTNFRHTAIMNR